MRFCWVVIFTTHVDKSEKQSKKDNNNQALYP